MTTNNLPDIAFSQNWNGKLLNDMFPTLRLPKDKYQVGQAYNLVLKGERLGRVELVRKVPMPFNRITDVVAFADVGKPAKYLRSVLQKMYKYKITNWSTATFVWLWFKHLDNEKERDNHIQQRSSKLGIQADMFQTHRTGVSGNH